MTVLLADEINKLCVDVNGSTVENPLIEPFCPSRLRAASYQLTLGDEIHVGGEYHRLDELESITLDPHQVAVVCTHEKLIIPRNLVARWSLRVTKIYEGLLWTGGPQVDPGWEGPLFCPIYNLAERKVLLKRREPMFAMDFVRTTENGDEYNRLKEKPGYERIWFVPQRQTTLADHDRYRLRSAPYEAIEQVNQVRNTVNATEERVGQINDRMLLMATIILTAIAAVVAALSVIVVQPVAPDDGELLGGWALTALAGSVVATVLSAGAIVLAFLNWRKR